MGGSWYSVPFSYVIFLGGGKSWYSCAGGLVYMDGYGGLWTLVFYTSLFLSLFATKTSVYS
jgi:hypothetical protein